MDDKEILVIDRFEDEYAICQNNRTGKIIEIKKEELPGNIKEGAHIIKENGIYVECSKNDDEKRVSEKMNRLFRKKK